MKMTSLNEQMYDVVRRAVQQGDTAVLEHFRAFLKAKTDKYSRDMLAMFERTLEYEIGMAAILKLVPMVEAAGDAKLDADFTVLMRSVRKRWEYAAAEARQALVNTQCSNRHWADRRNAVRYASQIKRAKDLMALGHDREHILDLTYGEKTEENANDRASFARILKAAGGLPPARRKRTR
jgi:hypothetical protein